MLATGPRGSARRRELFGADGRDSFAEFLFELAGQLADELTGCGRGVQIVAACNYIFYHHLRCAIGSSSHSHCFARNRVSTRRGLPS